MLIAIGSYLSASTYSINNVSEVGILVNSLDGSIQGPIMGPTTQFFGKSPWANLHVINTAVQTIQFDKRINGAGIDVLTKDNLNVSVDVTVRYQVSVSHIIDLFKHYPSQSWQNDAISPIIRSTVRDVIANYTASELQLVRAQIQAGIESRLTAKLSAEPSLANDIQLIQLDLRAINLPDGFTAAIQAKLNAQQDFIKASFEAQRIVVLANASAQAQIQQALGIKASQLIIANGTAASIQLIARDLKLNATQIAVLTQTYVFMQQMQALCAQSNAPCSNLILILGSGSNGQFFLLPTKTTP